MTTATQPTIGASHIVSRVFNAPRELVWKANTEGERMGQWLAPKGFTALVKSMDFRIGGVYHYAQISADKSTYMWGKITYKEIHPIEKLVFIQSFSDENGGIGTHPMAPLWPKEMLSTTTFEDLGGNRTRMSVEWAPYNASPEEQAFFDGARDGITGGWNGSFDHLADYLKTAQP